MLHRLKIQAQKLRLRRPPLRQGVQGLCLGLKGDTSLRDLPWEPVSKARLCLTIHEPLWPLGDALTPCYSEVEGVFSLFSPLLSCLFSFGPWFSFSIQIKLCQWSYIWMRFAQKIFYIMRLQMSIKSVFKISYSLALKFFKFRCKLEVMFFHKWKGLISDNSPTSITIYYYIFCFILF